MSHREFYDFYRQEVVAQVRRAALLTGSDAEANDIVHDVLIRMYQRWDEIDDPAPYLNRTVLNGCRDRARRGRRQAHLLQRLRPVSSSVTESDFIDDLLERLPFRQRAAVVLRYHAGWSTQEIADALDCPPGSVGPWIDRALRTLRKELS